jgi:hypothetical protein
MFLCKDQVRIVVSQKLQYNSIPWVTVRTIVTIVIGGENVIKYRIKCSHSLGAAAAQAV